MLEADIDLFGTYGAAETDKDGTLETDCPRCNESPTAGGQCSANGVFLMQINAGSGLDVFVLAVICNCGLLLSADRWPDSSHSFVSAAGIDY